MRSFIGTLMPPTLPPLWPVKDGVGLPRDILATLQYLSHHLWPALLPISIGAMYDSGDKCFTIEHAKYEAVEE